MLKGLVPDSLVGRTVAALFLTLLVAQVISSLVYEATMPDQPVGRGVGLAERIAVIRRTIAKETPDQRLGVAASLSGRMVRVQWSITPFVAASSVEDKTLIDFEGRLRGFQPELSGGSLHAAYAGAKEEPPDDPLDHVVLVSSRLDDGSWVNFVVVPPEPPQGYSRRFVIAVLVMSGATLAVSILLARALTAPFRKLERASLRLGVDPTAPALPEMGPREIRNTTRAFNEMQARIRRLIVDRTNMLAAISHDLRNPITTLRLRAEFVEDDTLRDKVMADLDEMEAMVAATLAFLREDGREEESRIADVAAILGSICDTLVDMGQDVRCGGSAHAPLRCRPLSLKRALRNLVENAIKYGGCAVVLLRDDGDVYRITVRDDGPGLPEGELEAVFAPFYRRDRARSRDTGGFGLGLTVARSVLRSHGGDVTLSNLPEGGVEATVILPKVR